MKIVNLVKSEFKKNFNGKRLFIATIVLIIASILLLKVTEIPDLEVIDMNFYADSWTHSEEFILEELEKEKSFEQEYSYQYTKTVAELLRSLRNTTVYTNGWKYQLVFQIADIQSQNYLIEKLKKDATNSTITGICDGSISQTAESYQKLYDLCTNYKEEEREKIYLENEKKIEDYKEILKKDKYYLYLQYEIEHGNKEANEFINSLIEAKVESYNDYRASNYLQYLSYHNNVPDSANNNFKDKIIKDNEKYRAILLYSTKNQIKHDLNFNYYDSISVNTKTNTKMAVNQVYHLSFIVMLLISIMYGGIVSNEHSKGTIKNIISAPVRRWKILASKFIYLVLNMYLFLFLGLVIISIIAGIKYGFSDLFTPKLLYEGGKVIEVNYYLDTIKNLLLFSLPLYCYLSILFFLSTVTLNTSLTVGITSVVSVLSPIVWLMSLYSLVLTPIWYFDCGFLFNNDFHYAESLIKVSYSWQWGIFLSLLIGIILYALTTLIYSKRDIKN